MARIDCSVTVNFLKEWRRYCSGRRCGYCNLSEHNECGFPACQVKDHPEEAVEIVQKWSDEHLVKTRIDDLKERFPNVSLGCGGVPCFSPSVLGYCGDCDRCRNWKNPDTRNCWDEPLVGGATGKAVE